MENKGRYIVLLKNELFRINYIEKGYTRDLSLIDEKYGFDDYDKANEFIKENKKELNDVITNIKVEEQNRLRKMLEDEQRERENASASKKTKKEKKNKEKNETNDRRTKTRRGAWFLAGIAAIPTAYLLYRGVDSIVDDIKEKKSVVSVSDNEFNYIKAEIVKFLKEKNILANNISNRTISTYQIELLTVEFVQDMERKSNECYEKGLYNRVIEIGEFLNLSKEDQIKFVTSYLTEKLGFIIKEVKYEYDYSNNAAVVKGEDYVELTTDAFETLVSLKVKELNDKGVNIASEDIIKYAMLVNLDKLAQDNVGLINTIVGEQQADEIQEDSYKFTGAVVMYNYNIWYTEGSTKNFIRISDMIFDEEARLKVLEIENRIDEIALASKTDVKKMNELITKLLRDLLDPECELSYLESGVGFALQIMLEPIRGLWGMDLYGNIVLDETNAELIKYFVPYAGDEEKYTDNNMLNGYIQDIHNLLTDCPKHTKTK